MAKEPEVKIEFVVRYKPNGVDPSIKAGVHCRMPSRGEAEEELPKCLKWFNESRTHEGLTPDGKDIYKHHFRKVVDAWIEEYRDDELYEGDEECEESPAATEKKPVTSSTGAATKARKKSKRKYTRRNSPASPSAQPAQEPVGAS